MLLSLIHSVIYNNNIRQFIRKELVLIAAIPQHLIDTKYELCQFIGNVRRQAFPQFKEEGRDLKRETLVIHQPYTSGHTITFVCKGIAPDRRFDVIFNIEDKDIMGLDGFYAFSFEERLGFLDAYWDDSREALQKELNDLLQEALSRKVDNKRD